MAITLKEVTPTLGWAGVLADFDRRIFGRDAWPLAVWKQEMSGENTYIAYVGETAGIATFPDIAALAGASGGLDAEILTIGVAPEFRRHGLGSRILRHLIEHARESGSERIFLEVRSRDEGARAFYGRHGFEDVGLRRRYYSDDDAVVMCLNGLQE